MITIESMSFTLNYVTWSIGRKKKPEDSDKGSDSESDLSSDSDDEATADREIILKHKDANDLLNALAFQTC